jgi:redox-sensitive bicupin YhaK (pirin superfamily)
MLEDDRPFELRVPAGHTAFAFVHTGVVDIGAQDKATPVAEGNLAILGAGNRIRVRATSQRSGLLLAAGKPLREPIVQRGPFVMNTEEEIAKCWADYRAGVLDKT